MRSSLFFPYFLIATISFFSPLSLNGIESTWTGGGGAGNTSWESLANWNNPIPNGIEDIANFPSDLGDISVSNATNIQLETLNVNAANMIVSGAGIGGDPLLIHNGIIFDNTGTHIFTTDNLLLEMANDTTIDMSASAGFDNFRVSTNSKLLSGGDLNIIGPGVLYVDGQLEVPGNLSLTDQGLIQGSLESVANCSVDEFSMVVLSNANDWTCSTNFSGAGQVEKYSEHKVTLTGNNTYQGVTTIHEGSLQGSVSSIPSTGGVVVDAGASVIFDQTGVGQYHGVISGEGSVEKVGGSLLELTNTNTYSGGTTITAGTLQVTTTTIPSTGNITNDSILVFEQNDNGTYARVISGTGSLDKKGAGIVTLSGANTYEGATSVTAGTLSVTGSLANASDVTVAAGATLTGSGSVGAVTNHGLIEAGLQGGETFTINGNYVQGAGGTFSPTFSIIKKKAKSSLLDVTGTATLDGTLKVNMAPGNYQAGTAFTVLSAAGGFGGSTFATYPSVFKLTYANNNVILTLLKNINPTTYTWTGAAGDNDWSTGGNWDLGDVPNSVDAVAVFPINAAPALSEEITVQKVILQNNSVVDVTAENFALLFSTPKKQNSVQGGTFQVSGAAGMALNDGAQMTLVGNAGELIGLANLSGGGETNTLRFVKSKQKSLGSGDTLFNLNTVTNLNAAITNNGGCQLLLNGTNSFDQTFTNTGRAIVATLQGSDNTFNDAVTNTKGGTFQTLGNAANTFAADATFTNASKSIFQSLETSDNTFTAAVANAGTMQLSGDSTNTFEAAGGTLTNYKKSSVQCSGTSTNTFAAITNAGTIQCLESSENFFEGALTNSGTMRFYGSVGAVGSTNTFTNAVNNTGDLLFYGIDDLAGNGHSINNFNDGSLITNSGKRTIQFFENSVNAFKVEGDTAVSNEGTGKVLFYGNSENTFGDAGAGFSTVVNLGKGKVLFYGNSVNTFTNDSGALNQTSGTVQFYGNSVNTFTDASAALNEASGAIQFYGNSINIFTRISAAINGGAGSIGFYGNSVNTFTEESSAINEASGTIQFYGNSVNDFDATSVIINNDTGSIQFYGNADTTFTGGGAGDIDNPGKLLFYGNSTTTCAKNITGAGAVSIYGNANVDLSSGANAYTGATTIYQNGTLDVKTGGAITASTITVGNTKRKGGTLTGEGSVHNVTLARNGGGTVKPDNLKTLTVTGDFVQNNGTLHIQIHTVANPSKLAVTGAGTISLGGPLFLELLDGYAGGEYEILTCAAGVGEERFSKITTSPVIATPAIAYNANDIKVTIPEPIATILFPTNINKLDKNKQAIAKHLVKSAPLMHSNKDAQHMVNSLARQPVKKFKQDLMRLAPIAHTVSAQRGLQNIAKLVGVLNHQFLAEKDVYQSNRKDKHSSVFSLTDLLSFQTPQTGFFIDTLGHVEQTTSFESPFSVQTKGANFGWNKIYRGQFVFEGGLSCTTSELKSQDGMGNLSWSSLSFAPMLGWFNENAYASLTLLGGVSFYNQSREIAYADIYRHALSQYHGLDLLAKLGSGYRLDLGNNLSLQADAGLNVQALYTSSYQERGAESLNLSVKGRREMHLEPNLKVQGSKVFLGNQVSYTPTLYLSWSKDQRLDSNALCARFDFAQKGEYFEIQEASKRNQKLVVGTDFTVKRLGQFELSANVEADMMSRFEDYSMKAKLQWMF